MKKNMIDDLLAAGIKLTAYNLGSHKTTCPKCAHTRKNKADRSLYVTVQEANLALWKCYNCGDTGAAGIASGQEPPVREFKPVDKKALKQQAKSLPPEALAWLVGVRKIPESVINKNRLFWDEQQKMVGFPFYENDQIVNIKYRSHDKKDFRLKKGGKLVFYGIDDFKASKETTLIIVEGEIDKLALNACGVWNVVSVPNGAPSETTKNIEKISMEYLANAEELISKCRKIILACDADGPGKALANELARRIGFEKCWKVDWLDQKDANDVLINYDADTLLDCINNATAYPINGIVNAGNILDEVLNYFNGGMQSGVSTGWDNVDRLFTVMPGEVTVVTGIPNSGKSEWLDALAVNLMHHHGWKAAIFTPENKISVHINKLAEKIAGKSIDSKLIQKLKEDGKSVERMTENELKQAVKIINDYFFYIQPDDSMELPKIEWIFEKARSILFRHGIKTLVIDPYNWINHTPANGESETQYIQNFLTKLIKFAASTTLHVFIVAHPAKMQTGKDGRISPPTAYDISSSSHWFNRVHNIITIHRDGAKVKGGTLFYTRKVKFKWVGKQGDCKLIYDPITGRYMMPDSEKNPEANYSLAEDLVEGKKVG